MEGLTLHSVGVVLSEVGRLIWAAVQTAAFWQNMAAFLIVMFVSFAVIFVVFWLSFKLGLIKQGQVPATVERLWHLDHIAGKLREQGMEDAAKAVEDMK